MMPRDFNHTVRRVRLSAAVAALATCCLLSGCGAGGPKRPSAHPVEGKLTLDGKPYGPISVLLSPANSLTWVVGGEADEQGNLKFTTTKPGDGAPAGEYKVTILPDPMSRASQPPPAAYHKFETTPLTVKIEAKKNTIQLALESKGKSNMPGAEMIRSSATKKEPSRPKIDPKFMPKTDSK